MFKASKNHLNEVKESYWEHFVFGFTWGCQIIKIGMLSIIHAVIPSLFKRTTPEEILKIASMIKEKHPDLYEKYLNKKNND